MPWRHFHFLTCFPDLQLGSLHYVNLTGRRIKKFFKRSDDEFIFYDPVRFTSWFPSHLPKSGVTRGLVLTRFCSNSSNADPCKGIAWTNWSFKLYFSYVASNLGATVLVWTISTQGFTVIFAMQIRDRALLKHTDYVAISVLVSIPPPQVLGSKGVGVKRLSQ